MPEIIPAIMPKKFSDIEWNIRQVTGAVKVVQIDIMDGVFVKNISWPYGADDAESFEHIKTEAEGMPEWEAIDYELDLMVADPGTKLEELMSLAPKRIVFHVESIDDVQSFFDSIDHYVREHVEFGIALNTTTPIEAIKDAIPYVQFVQCMGIAKIGYQGEPFDERVLEQVRRLRSLYPELTISIDGAVNEKTAPLLLAAGADRLVIGSAIWKSTDIREAINDFKSL